MKMPKSPPELIARFDGVATDFPEATRRLTFGYPCLYVGGNMVTGLFGDAWHVRVGADDTAALLALPGAGPFEPMPGRPMTGFTQTTNNLASNRQGLGRRLRGRLR